MNNQLPFTTEQLVQLEQFPKLTLDHANKKLSQELMNGKSISNQFGYFLSICKNYKPSQSSSYKPKSPSPEDVANRQKIHDAGMDAFMKRREETRRNILIKWGYNPDAMTASEKADFFNREKMQYYTSEDLTKKEVPNEVISVAEPITHKETDYEFALNFEKLIHARTLKDPIFAKKCSRFDKNPVWDKLSTTEQGDIWNLAHTSDCSCRKNEDAGLILPDVVKKRWG